MKANAVPLLALFESKMRLEVPLFQRQYVWERESQWEPLWEDIRRKFSEYLEGRKDAPVHFLGAMVLDLKMTPTTHVTKRQVIDGQQRLTTFQLFLAALRDFSREEGCEDLAKEFDRYTLNTGMMADTAVEKYKVWPTQADRGQFTDVMGAGSRAALEKKHPLTKKKYARYHDPRPRMVEAYLYFADAVREYFVGTEQDPPLAGDQTLAVRIDECLQALKVALQVVVIDLEQGDDAQVIFETLNARGQPLIPADLLRNYIFLRAGRRGESQDDLYQLHWKPFEDAFWSEEVRQGRLSRPRSDLFMQHFLVSRRAVDVPVKHLFVEYRHWIEKENPFPSVTAELTALASQREAFRRLHQPTTGDPVGSVARLLLDFDIGTAHSLLLLLFDKRLDDGAWASVSATLESYLFRRAFLNLGTKSYTHNFVQLIKTLKQVEEPAAIPDVLRATLLAEQKESARWPGDTEFAEAWRSRPAYSILDNSKLTHVLRRLNDTYLTKLHEPLAITTPLTVEHLLPRSWREHWPLPGGQPGLSDEELTDADPADMRAVQTRERNAKLHTWGNLTIITQGLNAGLSNSPWAEKRPELLTSSLLPINQQLHHYDVWDEAGIRERGEELLGRALKLWPSPTTA